MKVALRTSTTPTPLTFPPPIPTSRHQPRANGRLHVSFLVCHPPGRAGEWEGRGSHGPGGEGGGGTEGIYSDLDNAVLEEALQGNEPPRAAEAPTTRDPGPSSDPCLGGYAPGPAIGGKGLLVSGVGQLLDVVEDNDRRWAALQLRRDLRLLARAAREASRR